LRTGLFEFRDQFAHTIVDLSQCDRRMDKLFVVNVQILLQKSAAGDGRSAISLESAQF
jgi:hypothetical protein